MGACVSYPVRRVKVKTGLKRRIGKNIRGTGKEKKNGCCIRNCRFSPAAAEHCTPPSIAGSAEEIWFEPASLFGSDSEEDFLTVNDDTLSIHSLDFSSPKDDMNKEQNLDDHRLQARFNLISMPGDLQSENLTLSSAGKTISREKDDSSLITHNCLPCLKTSVSSPGPSARKKVVPGNTFTTSEGQNNTAPFSLKMPQKRPLAGSQVPMCPLGKEMFDSWSPIEPSTFRVRGPNYLRDKKKEHASNKAAYYPFGVDIYLSQRKINHIARFVELPAISSSPKLPALLVVNVQIPLYPPAIFQNENDGEGMNVVMYFKLSDKFEKEVPLHFQGSIRRLIDNEVEKIKGFPMDTIVPFRERLKILSQVSNVDNLQLNVPQRKLMHAYNEKPILSRPQHEFYLGGNYFEIDIDMHRFSYISRKGFDAFQDTLKICILDIGLTIQGNKPEELPEQVLCCIQMNGIDHTNYHHLEPSEETL